MLDLLKEKNPHLTIHTVDSAEFATYGRVLTHLDTAAILAAAQAFEMPESGSLYRPSAEEFESLPIAAQIENTCFGTLPTQLGYCWGHSNHLNAAEWHKSSEVNIAVTPLVLLLAHVWEIRDGKLDAADFRAFYLPAGTAVEVYATSLHFCPCEVQKSGFGCIVALPEGTNTDLTIPVDDPLLFRKNKWIVAHEENAALLARGVVSGITGVNYEIKY